MLLTGALMAEPMTHYYQAPQPVGGTEALKQMTHYPDWAVEMGLEGEVVLSFSIDEQGRVQDVEILKSGGHLFDEAAKQAVTSVKWQPASSGNHPVESHYVLPFEFTTSNR